VKIGHQFKGWLWVPGLVIRREVLPVAWAMQVIKLFALFTVVWVLVRWSLSGFRKGTDLAVVSGASIGALIPMLFVFSPIYRYAMLGWDLALIVLIVSVARFGSVTA
jgi:hypothetical protein